MILIDFDAMGVDVLINVVQFQNVVVLEDMSEEKNVLFVDSVKDLMKINNASLHAEIMKILMEIENNADVSQDSQEDHQEIFVDGLAEIIKFGMENAFVKITTLNTEELAFLALVILDIVTDNVFVTKIICGIQQDILAIIFLHAQLTLLQSLIVVADGSVNAIQIIILMKIEKLVII